MRQPSDGVRVLTGAEWELFVMGLEDLTACVENDIWSETSETKTGASAFDAFTSEQKLALLADVATVLRDPAVPTPKHTAATDRAVAALARCGADGDGLTGRLVKMVRRDGGAGHAKNPCGTLPQAGFRDRAPEPPRRVN